GVLIACFSSYFIHFGSHVNSTTLPKAVLSIPRFFFDAMAVPYVNKFQTSSSHRATLIESMMPLGSRLRVAKTNAGKNNTATSNNIVCSSRSPLDVEWHRP